MKYKIEEKYERLQLHLHFEDLNEGNVFVTNILGDIYIKIKTTQIFICEGKPYKEPVNAVRLRDGALDFFTPNTVVKVYNKEIVFEENGFAEGAANEGK